MSHCSWAIGEALKRRLFEPLPIDAGSKSVRDPPYHVAHPDTHRRISPAFHPIESLLLRSSFQTTCLWEKNGATEGFKRIALLPRSPAVWLTSLAWTTDHTSRRKLQKSLLEAARSFGNTSTHFPPENEMLAHPASPSMPTFQPFSSSVEIRTMRYLKLLGLTFVCVLMIALVAPARA